MRKPGIVSVLLLVSVLVLGALGCDGEDITPTPTVTPTLTITSTPTPAPTIDTDTYTNAEHGISFIYPSKWRQVGLTGYTDSIWKTALEEPVSGIAPGVGIIKYDMKGKTLEDFHYDMAEELVVFGARNVLSIVEVKINGLDAYITTFTEESYQGTIKGKEMTITKDHKIAYCVDCYSLLSDYDRSEKNFDMIHNSFKIE